MSETVACEAAPECPCCGAAGAVALTDCHDFVHGMDGRWDFRRCARCGSLWLDPRPAREALPMLYPDAYYTHTPPGAPLEPPPGFGMRAVFSLKLGIVAGAFNYGGLDARTPLPAVARAARRLAALPLLAGWAGHYVRFVPFRPGGQLLDVGSANGTFLLRMRELGWAVEGIEPDAAAAALAAEAGLSVYSGPVEEAPLEAERYDAITLHHVIEHFADPGSVLSRLAVALRPGGLLVSVSPNPCGLLARWFGRDWRGLEPPRHAALPGPRGYAALLARAGLQPVRIWTSTRTTPWMCYESLAIRRTGRTEAYRLRAGPEALASLARILAFAARAGEEVICSARKPAAAVTRSAASPSATASRPPGDA